MFGEIREVKFKIFLIFMEGIFRKGLCWVGCGNKGVLVPLLRLILILNFILNNK